MLAFWHTPENASKLCPVQEPNLFKEDWRKPSKPASETEVERIWRLICSDGIYLGVFWRPHSLILQLCAGLGPHPWLSPPAWSLEPQYWWHEGGQMQGPASSQGLLQPIPIAPTPAPPCNPLKGHWLWRHPYHIRIIPSKALYVFLTAPFIWANLNIWRSCMYFPVRVRCLGAFSLQSILLPHKRKTKVSSCIFWSMLIQGLLIFLDISTCKLQFIAKSWHVWNPKYSSCGLLGLLPISEQYITDRSTKWSSFTLPKSASRARCASLFARIYCVLYALKFLL